MKKIIFTTILLFAFGIANSQEQNPSEIQKISETIMLYIDGTANGEPDKLEKAFHPKFNLYSVTKEDSLRVWEGKNYISRIKEGQKSNRIGRIVAIDYDQNVATAKVEIIMPNRRVVTDYFMLLKYQGTWKIIHKSYTIKNLVQP